jgi:hypothetical protein
MFWKWIWKVLAILVILAIFVGGGLAIYKAGYANGVAAAYWEAQSSGEVPPQTLAPRAGPGIWPYVPYRPFFPGLSLFFGFVLLLFFFGGIGRLIRYSRWRSEELPNHPHWGPGWHSFHHPHTRGAGPSRDQAPKKDESSDESGSSE